MVKDLDITVTLAPCAQTLKVVLRVNAWMDGQATVQAAQVGKVMEETGVKVAYLKSSFLIMQTSEQYNSKERVISCYLELL